MRVYTKDEYEQKKQEIIDKIKKGAIFIYPTDTIYGIGCDATNPEAVKKVRLAKGNFVRPLSVIVPEKEWIYTNCEIIGKEEEWLEKLPGPYTLILNMRCDGCVASNVTSGDTLGIRMPGHWCTEISRFAKVPIITTSANLTGGLFMTSIDTLNDEVKKHVDFMIDTGEIRGKPSTIVHLYDEEIKVVERE